MLVDLALCYRGQCDPCCLNCPDEEMHSNNKPFVSVLGWELHWPNSLAASANICLNSGTVWGIGRSSLFTKQSTLLGF